MGQAPVAISKTPTESPQLAADGPARPVRPVRRARQGGGPVRAQVLAGGSGRAATRGGGEVIELECGILRVLKMPRPPLASAFAPSPPAVSGGNAYSSRQPWGLSVTSSVVMGEPSM